MALKDSDIREHNNPNNAHVDSDFVRGGGRVVNTLSEMYALASINTGLGVSKQDQLKAHVTIITVLNTNTDNIPKKYELISNTDTTGTGAAKVFNPSAFLQQFLGEGISLGETSTTAGRGDRAKIAYDHSQDTTNNPHEVTKAQVGLSDVDNTSDVNKPVSTAQQTALNLKANDNEVVKLTGDQIKSGHLALNNGLEVTGGSNLSGGLEVSGQGFFDDNLEANSFVKTEGISTDALMADGTVKAIGNVDNTSDANKPLSIAAIAALSTKELNIAAGIVGQYWRGDKSFQTLNTLAVVENTNLYYTQARFDDAFTVKNTGNLTEGTNLYYTNARSDARITAQKGVANGIVPLDANAKILSTYFPDSILGQLKYGGTYNGIVISASSNFPELQGLNLPTAGANYVGVFFIATATFTRASVTYDTGDWVLHNGNNNYVKVDNSDAVSTVFGRIGNILANQADYEAFYPKLSESYVNPAWIASLPYNKITGIPTNLSQFTNDLGNYGSWITQAQGNTFYSDINHIHSFSSLSGKPSTIGGYGITDFNALGDVRWEPIFTKNTAFNKNFGTTSGTVADGGYSPSKVGLGASGTWYINIAGSSAYAEFAGGASNSDTLNNQLGSFYTNIPARLGFTPYNATNPSGFITSVALSPYALNNGTNATGFWNISVSEADYAYYAEEAGYAPYAGNASTANNSNALANLSATQVMNFQSGSDFPNGTLVTTDIPATASEGHSFVIEISGKSYDSGNPPFKVIAQGYLYANTIINASGRSYGGNFAPNIKMFEQSGVLCFWWSSISYWNSFNIHVRNADGEAKNRVTGIINSTEPTGTKKVTCTLSVALASNNFNNYSPTLTGGNASGTWGININGNATTATNANALNGFSANFNSVNDGLDFLVSRNGGSTGSLALTSANGIKNWLGLGSAAYLTADTNPTDNTIVRRTGSGLAMILGGYLSTSLASTDATTPTQIATFSNDGTIRKNSASSIKSFLGLGSNAYNSTAYLAVNNPANFTGTFANVTSSSTEADWSTMPIWAQSNNQAGYGFHIPGQYGAALTMNNSGVLRWGGNGLNVPFGNVAFGANLTGTSANFSGDLTTSHTSGYRSNFNSDSTILSSYNLTGGRKWQIDALNDGFSLFIQGAGAYVFNVLSNGNATFSNPVTAPTFNGSLNGNAATATNLSNNQLNWATTGGLGNVVGMLAWKAYGNNHVIFDASAGTSPSGSAISQSNSQEAWTNGYPTLMGWNGTNTYGVRVYSARIADLASRANGNFYIDADYGCGIVGLYESTRYQGVFSMGDAYRLASNGTSLSNHYGIAWTHENVGGQAKTGLGHQMLITEAGVTQTAIGNGIWTRANIYALGTIRGASLNIEPGDGNGIRFWESDQYKISMGVGSLYQYGSVTDYSIKLQMNVGSPGRGITFGGIGLTPVASINTTSGNATFAGTVTASGGFFNSDIRLKNLIPDLDYSNIGNLKTISFNWKDGRDDLNHYGYAAQEVEKYMPHAINYDDKGFMSVNYTEVLVAKVFAIEKKVKQLEEELKNYKN